MQEAAAAASRLQAALAAAAAAGIIAPPIDSHAATIDYDAVASTPIETDAPADAPDDVAMEASATEGDHDEGGSSSGLLSRRLYTYTYMHTCLL